MNFAMLRYIVMMCCTCLPLSSQVNGLDSPTVRTANVLVITAVDYEFAAVSGLLQNTRRLTVSDRQVAVGTYNGRKIEVIRAGWGKAQAAAATATGIRKFAPDVVVMAGIGGGIDNNSVTSGDVIIVQGTFQYDLGELAQSGLEIWPPETPQERPYSSVNFQSTDILVSTSWRIAHTVKFRPWVLPASCGCEKDGTRKSGCTAPDVQLDRSRPRVCAGIVASGDAFLIDPLISEKLAKTRQAVAVDMETAAVAEEATNSAIPFVGVRVVADVVNGSNEDLYYCLKPYSGPRLRDVMREILAHLGDLSTRTSQIDRTTPCQQPPQAPVTTTAQTLSTGTSPRPVRLR